MNSPQILAISTRICLLGLLLALLGGCSAPHDNPFDPDSDRYQPSLTPAQLTGVVRSVHVSRIFPSTDSYSIVTELTGGDAWWQDSVWVSYNSGAPVSLSRVSNSLWATVFSASYFGDSRLGSVIGLPFAFTARDDEGISREVSPVYLFRVIAEVPVVLEPDSFEIASARPTLVWQPFVTSFQPFFYRVAVQVITEGFEFNVWTSDTLASTIVSAEVPDSLPDGQYYWTLTVFDGFQNSSRSKEGMFLVEAATSVAGQGTAGRTIAFND